MEDILDIVARVPESLPHNQILDDAGRDVADVLPPAALELREDDDDLARLTQQVNRADRVADQRALADRVEGGIKAVRREGARLRRPVAVVVVDKLVVLVRRGAQQCLVLLARGADQEQLPTAGLRREARELRGVQSDRRARAMDKKAQRFLFAAVNLARVGELVLIVPRERRLEPKFKEPPHGCRDGADVHRGRMLEGEFGREAPQQVSGAHDILGEGAVAQGWGARALDEAGDALADLKARVVPVGDDAG